MCVRGHVDNLPIIFLETCRDAAHPVVRHYFVERRAIIGVDFQHAANDISTFPRQDAEKPPWALDHFLSLAGLLSGPWKWRGVFAGRALGLSVATGVAGLLLSAIGRLVVLLTLVGGGFCGAMGRLILFRSRWLGQFRDIGLLCRMLEMLRKLMGGGREIRRRFRPRLMTGIRDRSARSRRSNKQPIGIVSSPWLLPRKAAQGHAAEDDSQRPNIRRARVVFLLVINLGSEIRIRTDNAFCVIHGLARTPLCQKKQNQPEAGTISFSKG